MWELLQSQQRGLSYDKQSDRKVPSVAIATDSGCILPIPEGGESESIAAVTFGLPF